MTSALTFDALKAHADSLTNDIKAVEPTLTFMFAIHHQGQLQSTLHVMEDLILEHPAGHIARSIINRIYPPMEPSAFQGLAASQSRSWFSLSCETSMLALVSINVDQYDSLDKAQFDLLHHTWQGLEMADLCRRPDMLERLQNRPMIPKRGPMSEAKACLRGDIFSALMMATDGYPNAIDDLAKIRALQVLQRSPQHKPENYPFAIARQATEYALHEVYPTLDAKRSRLTHCRDITFEISDSTSDDQIQQWWHFCEPAQDMAWRGYDPAEILGAALNTSEDPYVRAIAHQIVEATGIYPLALDQVSGQYNPFADMTNNASIHDALAQEAFEVVLSEGLGSDSSRPFLMAANDQNRDLLQGRFLGWCANALQAAARAFDQALASGKPVAQAAKLEFEIHRDGPPVEQLNRLTQDIIHRQRDGQIVTMDMIPELTRGLPELDCLVASVKQTLTDPAYRRSLDAAQELTRTIEPETPMPHLGLHFTMAHQIKGPTLSGHQPKAAITQVLDFSPGGFSLPPQTNITHNTEIAAAPSALTGEGTKDDPLDLELVEGDET